MKKASGQVIFNSETNQIINFAIHRDANLISIINYSNKPDLPYKYKSFNDMFSEILSIAKANGYYFSSYNAFGVKWYDVSFIDVIKHPYKFEKYGYKEEE